MKLRERTRGGREKLLAQVDAGYLRAHPEVTRIHALLTELPDKEMRRELRHQFTLAFLKAFNEGIAYGRRWPVVLDN